MVVKIFEFKDGVLEALETSLSPKRMATYVQAAGGDREKALRLYTWNTAVSAAFYGPLQGLEVALRNAAHRQLSISYGPAWYDNPACGLDAGTLDRVDLARNSLNRGGYPVDPPHMVAELPIPPKLDSHSSANWTPNPPQTGRLFQVKLDSRSEATHGVDAVYVLGVTSVNLQLSCSRGGSPWS